MGCANTISSEPEDVAETESNIAETESNIANDTRSYYCESAASTASWDAGPQLHQIISIDEFLRLCARWSEV